jgi:two-component system phosphate regulon sensor histidine kinase PhoR
MTEALPWLLLVALLLGVGWFAAWLLPPIGELASVLRRIASGDFRPVILTGMPFPLRKAACDLRLLAETLSRQKSLIEEEEFSLTMILESMTEGVVIAGGDLRIRVMNKAAALMSGAGSGGGGLLLAEVFRSHELQGLARRAFEKGGTERGELDLVPPGSKERIQLAVTAAALKRPDDLSDDGVLLVLHDVTRIRELESVRREFVANVSHEFRTPLSVISGYLETLADEEVDGEMTRRSVAAMQRHALRLNRLIEDLLTISRMEEKGVRLDLTRIQLEPLLIGVIERAETESASRGVAVRLEAAPGLPDVEVDPYRIEQAFSNLLANALRHGVPSTDAPAEVVVSLVPSGNGVAVSFRDNGPGIPLADQKHIFERFYRVGGDRARQSGGTGLGLSIVKNVVHAHGGRVSVESSPGRGSTFTVHLGTV